MVYIVNAFPCMRLGKVSSSPIATGYLCATAAALHLPNITYHERENHKWKAGQKNLTSPSIYTKFEVSAPVLLLLFLGWCPWKKYLSVNNANTAGIAGFESVSCSVGHNLWRCQSFFPLYIERDRISVKYFDAGVRENRFRWQFWKKFWNGNMLLSSPSGEETQNHPSLVSCRRNSGECVWGFCRRQILACF